MSKRKNYPSIAERALASSCPECGVEVTRKSKTGPIPTFCSPEHRKAFGNRALVHGAAVINLLKGWRVDRGQGPIAQAAFQQLLQITDNFIGEDRAAGRPRPDYYAAKLMFDGRLYMDRERASVGRRKARESMEGEQ